MLGGEEETQIKHNKILKNSRQAKDHRSSKSILKFYYVLNKKKKEK